MNLLLLLSALLSALTGVGGTRGGPTPSAVCERSVESRAIRVATALVAMRPIQTPPRLAAMLQSRGVALMLARVEPLFASRRRE